jgi:hypothetical protein
MTKMNYAFSPRIIRSPLADFNGDDIGSAANAYSDEYLQNISEQGFNGIWLHGEIRKLVPTNLFPKIGRKKIDQLRMLVERAKRFGVKVYLYICEPRGMRAEDPFWKKHPELKGQPLIFKDISPEFDGTYYALCSSTPAVKEYLEGGMYTLFKSVPNLGGIFCITASEFHTHCYSHYPSRERQYGIKEFNDWAKADFVCPRCANRSSVDVTAEVIELLNHGVKRAAPNADVIAWTWSWAIIEDDPQKELIHRLPKDVILMSDWERGGRKKVCGKTFVVDEYSFSLPGPSPRYKKQLVLAKKRRLKMMAKIQIGSTHELVTVPYLPLPQLLAKKFEGLRKNKVDGYLGCWIFGGDVSPMSRLAGLMSQRKELSSSEAINLLAKEEFGEKVFTPVVKAWAKFSQAWQEYPFSIPFLYYGPINYATAYPLSLNLKKIPPMAGWLELPRDKNGHLAVGDNLESWISPFSPKLIAQAFEKLRTKWDAGVLILEKTMKNDPQNHRLKLEWNLAKHISLQIAATIDLVTFYPLYRKYQQAKSEISRTKLRKELNRLFERELAVTTQDKICLQEDPRIGYHAEARCHLFGLNDLNYKIELLNSILRS